MSLARGPAKILTGDIFAQTAVQIAPGGSETAGPHAPHPENSGRLQQSLLLLRDSVCARAQPESAARRCHRRSPQTCRGGRKEVVLSGINLGSYGRDFSPRAGLATSFAASWTKQNLSNCASARSSRRTSPRISSRSSRQSDRIAPHFHVPLQSGSDRILRAMHRWYRAELYAERMQLIRRLSPGAAIGADVIVGFPGETDADFQTTVEFIEQLPFTYLHVFSFSVRPGTAAAELPERTVAPRVIRERARRLRALSEKKASAFRASQSGRTLRALTLARTGEDWTEALTGNYLKVQVEGQRLPNEWCDARL